MATSGSYNYSRNTREIIDGAMRVNGLIASGEDPTPEEFLDGKNVLNLILKSIQIDGTGLWKNQLLTLFTQEDQYSYDIGPSSSDHCTPDGYKTELSAAAASGANTITVDSDDNMTDGDYIGIELDGGTVQWTTINGTPVSDVVTLTAVTTGAAAIDNHVYNYTNLCQRPLEIIEVRRVYGSGNELPLDIVSRDEYMSLPTKDSAGTITQVYYDPLLTNGKLYTWQATSNVQEYLKLTARTPIEDCDAFTDDIDIPNEYLLSLKWVLADEIGEEFEVGEAKRARVAGRAAPHWTRLNSFDTENASVFFSHDRKTRR